MALPIGESFWQKDSLITHILFELWLITLLWIVSVFLTQTLLHIANPFRSSNYMSKVLWMIINIEFLQPGSTADPQLWETLTVSIELTKLANPLCNPAVMRWQTLSLANQIKYSRMHQIRCFNMRGNFVTDIHKQIFMSNQHGTHPQYI